MSRPSVSQRQLERYPLYLSYLLECSKNSVKYISSSSLAKGLGLNEEKVRKDLQIVTRSKGIPNLGREVKKLIYDLETFLGYHHTTNAVVIGVGHLGEAFMDFDEFKSRGLNIVAGFDVDDLKVGFNINNKPVYHIDRLNDLIPSLDVRIAILTTPVKVAQNVTDLLVKAGIKGIWNFTPTHLNAGDEVIVEDVDLASSFAVLSYKLDTKFKEVK